MDPLLSVLFADLVLDGNVKELDGGAVNVDTVKFLVKVVVDANTPLVKL